MFVLGREILLDTKDFEGDVAAGLRTLVAYLGVRGSSILGWIFMFASTLIGVLTGDGISQIMLIVTLLSLMFSFLIWTADARLGLGVSRLSLVFGAAGAAFSI